MQPVIVGRQHTLGPGDMAISKNQIVFLADLSKEKAFVEVVGRGRTTLNGKLLEKKTLHEVSHGDKIELNKGSHMYQVEFTRYIDKGKDNQYPLMPFFNPTIRVEGKKRREISKERRHNKI